MNRNFLQLDPKQIVHTVETLCNRVQERFPTANLRLVAVQLLDVSRKAERRSQQIARPMLGVRALSALLVVGILAVFAFTVRQIKIPDQPLGATEFVQVTEAGFNAIILTGATVLFLVTLEKRVKRGRCLKAIHELRSIAHIIDMHQLTKDPDRYLLPGPDTQSSPHRVMTLFELTRYLDYCIEMLSLTGKIAALYVQEFTDPESVAAVNDLEDLTSGLSRKIWQKIMVIPPMVAELGPHSAHTSAQPSGGVQGPLATVLPEAPAAGGVTSASDSARPRPPVTGPGVAAPVVPPPGAGS